MGLWLIFIDIKARAGNRPRFYRGGQGGFVNDFASRRVDYVAVGPHFTQAVRIDEMMCVRRGWAMNRQEIYLF